jgi:hypothetical protein
MSFKFFMIQKYLSNLFKLMQSKQSLILLLKLRKDKRKKLVLSKT